MEANDDTTDERSGDERKLLWAARHGLSSDGELERILSESVHDKAVLLSCKDSMDGDTPLHVAVRFSNTKAALALLEHGSSAKLTNRWGDSPLHLACLKLSERVKAQCAELFAAGGDFNKRLFLELMKHGADPNAKNNEGKTPLQEACASGNLECAKCLLEHGADLNAVSNNGFTPLHLAVDSLENETVLWLLEVGATVNTSDYEGYTPLHVACRHPERGRYTNIVEKILQAGSDINARNNKGETPLHEACYHGRLNAAKTLIENGADMRARTRKGRTPLDIARKGVS